jgi:hypothetical protein
MNIINNFLTTHFLIKTKLAQIKKSASDRGYECTLTYSNVKKLLSEKTCQYTGEEMSSTNLITFERVDNTKGYIPGNVIPVLRKANHLKGDLDSVGLKSKSIRIKHRHNNALVHENNLLTQLDEKIKRREKAIAEMQAANLKDLQKKSLVENRISNLKNKIKLDLEGAELCIKIASMIDNNKNLGSKYITKYQKLENNIRQFLNKRLFSFRD